MIILAVIISLFLVSSAASVYAASIQVTFGATVNLSNNSGASTLPAVASVGTYVYVAWIDNSYGRAQVAFDVSSNGGGASWTLLTPPFQNLGGGAKAVQMYATGTYVFLTWVQGGNVAFAASSNNGKAY